MNAEKLIYRTRLNDIFIDEKGILCLQPDKNAEIDLEEVSACFEVYKLMGFGKERKVLQLIYANENVSITKEAREFAMDQGSEFFIASAVISNNLAIKLLVNFMNGFYRSKAIPFRLFNDPTSAQNWLLGFA
jgi:hypothetical protein